MDWPDSKPTLQKLHFKASNPPNFTQVVVALGSNQGDSIRILESAARSIQKAFPIGFRKSSVWRSAPVQCPPSSPDFMNGIALFDPPEDVSPRKMLDFLKSIEAEFGRIRGPSINAPRTLDLDLICFGEYVLNEPDLILPHPRAVHRRFVMEPLCELLPQAEFPVIGSKISDLTSNLRLGEQVCERV